MGADLFFPPPWGHRHFPYDCLTVPDIGKGLFYLPPSRTGGASAALTLPEKKVSEEGQWRLGAMVRVAVTGLGRFQNSVSEHRAILFSFVLMEGHE